MDLPGNLVCAVCRAVVNGMPSLNSHYREFHDPLSAYTCGQGNCRKQFRDKTSMIRHITSKHPDLLSVPYACARRQDSTSVQGENTALSRASTSCAPPLPDIEELDEDEQISAFYSDNEDPDDDEPQENLSVQDELKKAAVKVLMELRSTSSLTGKAVERFEAGCFKMLNNFASSIQIKISDLLSRRGMSVDEIQEVLKDVIEIKDPFENLRTIEQQLKYMQENYGLVIPQRKFLGTRLDQKLDHRTNTFVQTQVNETCQYVSITETLKTILSNKSKRNKIFKDLVSKDGVLRSYVDGSHYKDHTFLQRHKNVLHILLYYDELEIANALGSKTIIHKLGAFFFQILNLPPEESSQLSSIYLLALAYADELKKEGYMDKVLEPFILEMKKLASEEGVAIDIDGEVFTLRAVLVALTADNLAAHDVLGFLGSGARHFCRSCMVSRKEIRACANALGEIRTREMHRNHLAALAQNSRYSTKCGVKRSCPLDQIPFFHCVENNVFDIFHELLEGVSPLVIKCVLRHYYKTGKLIAKSFNEKIASFFLLWNSRLEE